MQRKRSISADEMHSTIYVELSVDHFGSWFGVNRFEEDVSRKDLQIFVPSDLDLCHLDLKFASLVN